MKNLKYLLALWLLTFATEINAQATVGINVGAPNWASGAPAKTNYYYLPDIETYYDVPQRQYIYMNNGAWTRTSTLPTRYKGYNLYTSRPVYLTDYKGNTPYVLYKEHKVKYKGKAWKRNGHDNGLHRGHGKKK